MKFKAVLLLALCVLASISGASFFNDEEIAGSGLDFFLGPKIITDPDDPSNKEYAFFGSLSPEFKLGLFSIGLDLRFQYNISEGRFYSEDWNTVAGVLRKVRFMKVGRKFSKYYFRYGEIKGGFITPGVLISNYNNMTLMDLEKRGLELDLDFGYAGFESMVNDISSPTMLAFRIFVRPLKSLKVPLLSTAQVGFSMAGDLRAPANVQYGEVWNEDAGETVTAVLKDDEGEFLCDYKVLHGWSLDVFAPITKFNILTTGVYAGYSKIPNEGTRINAGAYAHTVFDIKVNLEYRSMNGAGDWNVFDENYEVDKWNYRGSYLSKYDYLLSGIFEDSCSGIFGGISGNIFGKILLSGSYEDMEGPANGVLRLNLDLTRVVDKIKAYLTYSKTMIDHPDDLFTFDERSIFIGNISYALTKFFNISLDYKRIYRYNDEFGIYEPVETLTPAFLFSIDF
mgnify:CR=1 FL=1